MKRLLLVLLPISLFVFSCEEEQDTEKPTVSISYPFTNSTVSEMVTINCISSDNEGVDKVELWVNGVSTDISDNTEPYSFDWNTTLVDNGSYSITVRSYDTSDNTSDSEPIVLTVDNTQSSPQPINITSVVFDNGGFTITWDESMDGDFGSYELEKSMESTMNSPFIVFTTDSLEQTTYFDTDVNPLIYQYYRVTVIDTFDYETKGEIVSSSLDPVPTSVNVESVEYTLEEMTISWSESSDGDFKHYNLLTSGSVSGEKTLVTSISNKSTTSHTITEFNPIIENWYWVEVSDTLGQTSIGTGMTNEINPPTQIDITSVTYDLSEMVVTWEQSNDFDFVSYELLYSETQSGEQTSITTITDINTSSYTISDFNPLEERWYWIMVTDYWNRTSLSNGYMVLDSPPTSVLYPITYNDGYRISWSQNNDDDFVSYKLFVSLYEDMSNKTLVYETDDRTETTYSITIETLKYYQITIEDVWGLQSTSNIVVGDYEVELWGEYYSVLNTIYLFVLDNQLTSPIPPEIGLLTNLIELGLNRNQLTGEIPPEIGNLTNLDYLGLFDNQLTGEIPPEIGNLTNLSYLFLGSNQLSGIIPDEICDLVEVGVIIELYSNRLCPPYPSCIDDYTLGNQGTSDCD